ILRDEKNYSFILRAHGEIIMIGAMEAYIFTGHGEIISKKIIHTVSLKEKFQAAFLQNDIQHSFMPLQITDSIQCSPGKTCPSSDKVDIIYCLFPISQFSIRLSPVQIHFGQT